jgi:predicted ATPase
MLLSMRLSHVQLKNWRNFTRVDVVLQERNFLIGPNAAGKSNFLDAFRFLRDLARVGGGLQSAVGDRGGISKVRALAARQDPNVTIDVKVDDPNEGSWRYRLSFGQDRVRHDLVVKEEKVWHRDHIVVDRPERDDAEDRQRLSQTHLEQVSANRKFRPIADFFASIRYQHLVPQLIREADRWDSPTADPYGGDLIDQVLRASARTQRTRLTRIQRALAIAVPQLKELKAERDPSTGVPHLRGRYEHWRPKAGWQTEADFSDGTLRLFGLLWTLLEGGGPLLLEEPELSLHPEVVRYIPQLMARVQSRSSRQILLSTHSPDLLSDEGIAPDEIFLFIPSQKGTSVQAGVTHEEMRSLLQAGLAMPDVVMPITRPRNADQLALLSER